MPSARNKFDSMLESLERRMLSQDSWNGVDEQYERPYKHHSRRRSSMSEEQIMSEAVDSRTGKMKMKKLRQPKRHLTVDFAAAEKNAAIVADEFDAWAEYIATVAVGLEGFVEWQEKRRAELEEHGDEFQDAINKAAAKEDPNAAVGAEDIPNLPHEIEQKFPDFRHELVSEKLSDKMSALAGELRQQGWDVRFLAKSGRKDFEKYLDGED